MALTCTPPPQMTKRARYSHSFSRTHTTTEPTAAGTPTTLGSLTAFVTSAASLKRDMVAQQGTTTTRGRSAAQAAASAARTAATAAASSIGPPLASPTTHVGARSVKAKSAANATSQHHRVPQHASTLVGLTTSTPTPTAGGTAPLSRYDFRVRKSTSRAAAATLTPKLTATSSKRLRPISETIPPSPSSADNILPALTANSMEDPNCMSMHIGVVPSASLSPKGAKVTAPATLTSLPSPADTGAIPLPAMHLREETIHRLRSARLLFSHGTDNDAASASADVAAANLQNELEQVRREKMTQWNFDFATGQPLPGRYEWEPVHTSRSRSTMTESAMEMEVEVDRISPPMQDLPRSYR